VAVEPTHVHAAVVTAPAATGGTADIEPTTTNPAAAKAIVVRRVMSWTSFRHVSAGDAEAVTWPFDRSPLCGLVAAWEI
jgi:hypothetical protein